MVYMLSVYVIFVLYYQYIKNIEFGTFPESIFKEGIKLLIQSIKKNVLCIHNDVLRISTNNRLICLVGQIKYIMVRIIPYHLYFAKDKFK